MKACLAVILTLSMSDYVSAVCDEAQKEWSRDGYSEMHTIKGPYNIEQIETKHSYIPSGKTEPVIFGSSNSKWEKFKKNHKSGDQFYYVRTTLGKHYAEEYVLVRNNCLVGSYHLATR